MFTQAKHAHWNVKGPNFIGLHDLFEDIAQIAAHDSDMIAERITALGGRADGTARIAAAQSQLAEYPLALTKGMEYAAALADQLAAFGKSVREAVDRTSEYGDIDTADLLTEVSDLSEFSCSRHIMTYRSRYAAKEEIQSGDRDAER